MIRVRFLYMTGHRHRHFRNARLAGSWNGWVEAPMSEVTGDDGCPAFAAPVAFDDAQAGQEVTWGVRLDGSQGANVWAINREVPDGTSQERSRRLVLPASGTEHEERYHVVDSRRLGAQKVIAEAGSRPALRFAVWAPNARRVDAVFARRDHGYIDDDGAGIDPAVAPVPLVAGPVGVWSSAALADFATYVGAPYMYRLENAQGATVYRTDLHSRWQIGRGSTDPSKPLGR